VNIGDPWPDLDEAEARVLGMQTKLHRWAKADPGRRFDDLRNLVYDPAFLVVAWSQVWGNKGARTAGSTASHLVRSIISLGRCWG
jgi:RNA-directed DNA polymerase